MVAILVNLGHIACPIILVYISGAGCYGFLLWAACHIYAEIFTTQTSLCLMLIETSHGEYIAPEIGKLGPFSSKNRKEEKWNLGFCSFGTKSVYICVRVHCFKVCFW
jgi:hypothetical protein